MSYPLHLLKTALRNEIGYKRSAEQWLEEINLMPESRHKRSAKVIALNSLAIADERIPELITAIKKLKEGSGSTSKSVPKSHS